MRRTTRSVFALAFSALLALSFGSLASAAGNTINGPGSSGCCRDTTI